MRFFLSEYFPLLEMKFSIYLKRLVFLMIVSMYVRKFHFYM